MARTLELSRRWLPAVGAGGLLLDAALAPTSRAWQMAVLVALLGALGFVGSRLAAALAQREPGPTRSTAAFTLAVGVAVTGATALGHARLLTPSNFEILIACAALASSVRRREPGSLPLSDRGADRGHSFFDLLPAALLCFSTLAWIRLYRYLPPGFFAYDDLSYHLPAVATWLQYHDLRMLKLSFGDPGTTFYPIGAELWTWAMVAPFRDSDLVARWAQLPFAVFSLVAVAAIARRLGVSWSGAWLAVVSYWSLPRAFPELALSAGNDHSLAFFMLAGVDAALGLAARPDRRRAAYCGVVLGLMLGTKYLAVLFAPLLFLAWLAARGASRETQRVGSRQTLLHTAVVSGAALLVGGHTYLRTALATGNPLFPTPLALFGRELLPGWPGSDLATRRAGEGLANAWRVLWDRTDLLGPAFRWIVLPGAVAGATIALRAALRNRSSRPAAAVSLLPFGVLAAFLYLHDHRDVRYLFAGLALAGIAIAVLLARAPDAIGRPLARALSLILATVVIARVPAEMAIPVVAGAALACAAWVRWRRRAAGPRPISWAATAWAGAALIAIVAGSATIGGYQRRWRRHFPTAAALEQLAGASPQVFGYTGANRPYQFFGARLQHRVEIVPSRGPLESRFFDWGGNAGFPYRGNFRRWWQNLRALGVTFVILDQVENARRERRWMERHPDRFRRAYGAGNVEIWRVEPAALSAP